MNWSGFSYDREYCNIKTNNWNELYDCLDKHKIERKADYCNLVHNEDARYFGNNLEQTICLRN